MSRDVCGICVTPRDLNMQLGSTFGDCLRLSGHDGEHLFRNPGGQYFAWEDDLECGCCEPDELDRCIVYRKINEAEARELLIKRD